MNELGVQKWLINDFKREYRDAVAYKQSHRFMAGVPDLRLASKETGQWDVEVKYLPNTPRSSLIRVDLSPLQRNWGRKAIEAGMRWRWVLVIREGDRGYWVRGGSNYNVDEVILDSFFWRGRGEGWNAYYPLRLDL